MSDLAEFLLARIDEDEDQARYATPGPWQAVRFNLDPPSILIGSVEG